jgi:hypothetical protein
MTIYQVINQQNQLEYAFLNYEVAVEEIAKLSDNGQSFSINAVEDEDF